MLRRILTAVKTAALVLLCCGRAWCDLPPEQEQSVVEVRNDHKRMGTAFAIGKDTLITAHHVIDNEPVVRVVYKGRTYNCTVKYATAQWDMAVLRAEGLSVTDPIAFGGNVFMGQDVIIYGFPSGAYYSRTVGTVTKLDNLLLYGYLRRPAAMCTAIVRGGYSGGPVVDRHTNEVVGILTNRDDPTFREFLKSILTLRPDSIENTPGIFTRVDQIQRVMPKK